MSSTTASSTTTTSAQPIPISSANTKTNKLSPPPRHSFEYSPRTGSTIVANVQDFAEEQQEDNGVTCPPAFLPRERQNSEIRLDVFHHPAELYSPRVDFNKDPFFTSSSQLDQGSNMSPRINTDFPSPSPHQLQSIGFDNARSPVLAIHHSRIGPNCPEDEDEVLSRTTSGLSLSQNDDTSPRQMSAITSETTYVPMTPLPTNCCLSFFDRPREMATLIRKNAELFTLIEHAIPPEKFKELNTLWKTPRELIPDEDWVQKTRAVIAMGPDEAESGGALWVRWKELVGWESEDDEDEEDGDEFDWNYQPQDTSLHRRWNELDKARTTSMLT